MFSLDGYRPVDLSRGSSRGFIADGSIEEGGTDPYGTLDYAWGVFQETIRAAAQKERDLPSRRLTSHNGVHVQGGKGHISRGLVCLTKC